MTTGYNPTHGYGNTSGPKSILHAGLSDRFFDAIKIGLPLSMAADLVGISRNTFWNWIRKGSDPDSPEEYRAFVARLRQCEAEGTLYHLEAVKSASENGNWTASGWWLERKFPVEFGRTEISRTNYGKLSDRDLMEQAAQLGITIITEDGDRPLLENSNEE